MSRLKDGSIFRSARLAVSGVKAGARPSGVETLRAFCEGAVELLHADVDGGAGERGELSRVLPSLQQTLNDCGEERVAQLRAESQAFAETSEQLLRLIASDTVSVSAKANGDRDDGPTLAQQTRSQKLPSSELVDGGVARTPGASPAMGASQMGADAGSVRHGGGLRERLERGRTCAAQVIETLEALRLKPEQKELGAIKRGPTVTGLVEAGEPRPNQAEARALKTFCESVLALMQVGQDRGAMLEQALPSLVETVRDGSTGMVERLRREKKEWEARAVPLLNLAYSCSRDEAETLCLRLERTQEQAARVIGALEELHGQNAAIEPQPVSTGKIETSIISSSTAFTDRAEVEIADGSDLAVMIDDSGDLDRERAEAFYQLATGSHRKLELTEAERLYSAALRLNGSLREALVNRGRIRLMRGAAEPAAEDLTAALRLNSEDPLTLGWRGDAHVMSGRHDEGVCDYDRSLELCPDNFLVRYNRAVALRLGGRLESALAEFDLLLRFKPRHAPLYLNRGLIHQSRGELERAEEEYRTALRYKPNSREAVERLSAIGEFVQVADTASVGMEADEEFNEVDVARIDHSDVETGDLCETSAEDAGSVLHVADAASVDLDVDEEFNAADVGSIPNGGTKIPELREDSADAGSIRHDKLGPGSSGSRGTGPGGVNDVFDVYGMEIRCPECGEVSKVRWNKLQMGKVLSCPSCKRSFTSGGDGKMAEVVKNKQGRWTAARTRMDRTLRNRLLIGVAVALVGLGIWFGPSLKPLPAEDAGLPRELEPRAKVFAMAWLKGDYRTMRQLTDPVQGSQLFMWCMDNPAPALPSFEKLEAEGLKVVLVPGAAKSTARVQVQFDGLVAAGGPRVSELPLDWKQTGESWLFQPESKL